MNKERFVEAAIGLLQEHRNLSADKHLGSEEWRDQQLLTVNRLLDAYQACQLDSLASEDDRFPAFQSCMDSISDITVSGEVLSEQDKERCLQALTRLEKQADPWLWSPGREINANPDIEADSTLLEEGVDRAPEDESAGQEVSPEAETQEPELLYVNDPGEKAQIAAREQSIQPERHKRGFWSYLFTGFISHHNLDLDHITGLDGRNIRIAAEKKAYLMGFTKDECAQIGRDVSHKYLEDYYLGKSREAEDYLVYSKTFRDTAEGRNFLLGKGVVLDETQLRKLDYADQLRQELTKDLPNCESAVKRHKVSFKLFSNNLWKAMSNPVDGQNAEDALNIALRLGFSEQAALQIAKEVYQASDDNSAVASAIRTKLWNGKELTFDDFMANSATFRNSPLAQRYFTMIQLDKETDAIVKVSGTNGEGLDIDLASEAYRVDTGDPARQVGRAGLFSPQVGMSDAIGYAPAMMTVGNELSGFSPAPTVQQANQTEEQQRKTGIGGFLSSTIGMVVMMALFFFIARSAGASNLWAGLIAGGGGLFAPRIGDMLGGLFGQPTSMNAVPSGNLLDKADQVYGMRKAEAQQQDLQMGMQRDIQDGMAEQLGTHYNDQELMAVIKERGFAGLRTYLGNNEQLFNTFVTQHNLADLAKNEATIRLSNGDWLKATQSALNARDNLAMTESQSVNNGLKMNVKS